MKVSLNIQGEKSHGFCLDALHGCSDTMHGCSNTLHGYSDRMYVDFSMFSHLYPESYTPFSSLHFSDQTLPSYCL